MRAVTGMQKELQEARNEAGRQGERCASLQAEMGQMMEAEEKARRSRSENEHMRRQLAAAQRELTKLKDERCDLYVRHTAAIEEKSTVNIRSRDLALQVGGHAAARRREGREGVGEEIFTFKFNILKFKCDILRLFFFFTFTFFNCTCYILHLELQM